MSTVAGHRGARTLGARFIYRSPSGSKMARHPSLSLSLSLRACLAFKGHYCQPRAALPARASGSEDWGGGGRGGKEHLYNIFNVPLALPMPRRVIP